MFAQFTNPYASPTPEEAARAVQARLESVEKKEMIYFTQSQPDTSGAQFTQDDAQMDPQNHYSHQGQPQHSPDAGMEIKVDNSGRATLIQSNPSSSRQSSATSAFCTVRSLVQTQDVVQKEAHHRSDRAASSQDQEEHTNSRDQHALPQPNAIRNLQDLDFPVPPPHFSRLRSTYVRLPGSTASPPIPTTTSSRDPAQSARLKTWRKRYLHHLKQNYTTHSASWSTAKKQRETRKVYVLAKCSEESIKQLVESMRSHEQTQQGVRRRCSACGGGMHLLKCGHVVAGEDQGCRGNCWGSVEIGSEVKLVGYDCGECLDGVTQTGGLSAVEEVVKRVDYLDGVADEYEE